MLDLVFGKVVGKLIVDFVGDFYWVINDEYKLIN